MSALTAPTSVLSSDAWSLEPRSTTSRLTGYPSSSTIPSKRSTRGVPYSGTQLPQRDTAALSRHPHGKRRHTCRPATCHRRKAEATTKTAGMKYHAYLHPPSTSEGVRRTQYNREMPHFMRRELKIRPRD